MIKEYYKEMMQALLIKWLCEKNAWAAKHMHEISKLIGTTFTTSDLNYKNSRAYEIVKNWEQKGLVRIKDYTTKSKKYAFTTTLFAKTLEEKKISPELKQEILEELDGLI